MFSTVSRNNSKDSVSSSFSFIGKSLSPISDGLQLKASAIIGVEVIDYLELLDPSKYDNHIFVIRVNVGQLCYTINRSYSSFCELDARLRRKYPRCPIPILPLSGVNLFRASTAKSPFSPSSGSSSSSSSSSKKRAEDLRESMTSPDDNLSGGYASDGGGLKPHGRSPVKRKNKDEVIGQKKGPLNFYLQQLLALSEVLTSETFCHFIDPDPDVNYSDHNLITDEADVSDLDILLAKERRISKLIIRKLVIDIEVKKGHVIVWSFQTKNHDIGFSCNFNDVEVLQYQRYNSHISPISSCFEVIENGLLKLHWDNSYSKLRSKTINYVVKVYDKIEYKKAQKLAMEVRKEKQLLSQQREFLKRALIKVAQSNLIEGPQKLILLNFHDCDVIHRADKSDNNNNVLDLKDIETLEAEIVRLKDEKTSLQKAFSQSESLLIQEKEQTKILEEKVNDIYLVNKSISDENVSLKATIDEQKKEIMELKKEKDKLLIENAVNSSTTIMNHRRESLESSVLKYQFIIDDLQNRLNDAASNSQLLETQLAQLKQEKKQLRAFALQLKNELDSRSISMNTEDITEASNTDDANSNINNDVTNNSGNNITNSSDNNIIDTSDSNNSDNNINSDNNDNVVSSSENVDNSDSNVVSSSENADNSDSNVVSNENADKSDSNVVSNENAIDFTDNDNNVDTKQDADDTDKCVDDTDENSAWRVFKSLEESKIETPPVDSKGRPIITEVKRDSLWF